MTIEVRTSAQTITQTFSELITLDFKASGINTLNFKPAKIPTSLLQPQLFQQDYYEGRC